MIKDKKCFQLTEVHWTVSIADCPLLFYASHLVLNYKTYDENKGSIHMDKRVYLLTVISFVCGMVELIIGGILDLIAADFNISIGQAGLLITIFSLMFALSAPVLLVLTSKYERKKLTLVSLFVFFIANLIAIFSINYTMLFISRIISAASSSLLIVLCITMASNIVSAEYRGRALGIVNMGVSGSIVLGLPIGLSLGEAFGWRAPFTLIAILTIFSMIGVYFLMGNVAPKSEVPLKKQLKALKDRKITFALLTTLVFLAGHTTLYAYLKPYLQTTMNLDANWISIVYFLFGAAAVGGGAVGGTFADRIGTKQTIYGVILTLIGVMLIIPFAISFLPVFLVILIIWGMMSWAISPPLQSYLIEIAPDTSDILISLNNSALHLGVALGSLTGGIVLEQLAIEFNPFAGAMIVALSFLTAFLAIAGQKETKRPF